MISGQASVVIKTTVAVSSRLNHRTRLVLCWLRCFLEFWNRILNIWKYSTSSSNKQPRYSRAFKCRQYQIHIHTRKNAQNDDQKQHVILLYPMAWHGSISSQDNKTNNGDQTMIKCFDDYPTIVRLSAFIFNQIRKVLEIPKSRALYFMW